MGKYPFMSTSNENRKSTTKYLNSLFIQDETLQNNNLGKTIEHYLLNVWMFCNKVYYTPHMMLYN